MQDHNKDPVWKQALAGSQMLLVAFGALVLMPLITGLDPNVALFTAGIGTLIFHVVTGGQIPGTAQLAATASISGTPEVRSKARNSPVTASTAVTSSSRSVHSCTDRRDSMTARRADSGTVGASRAT